MNPVRVKIKNKCIKTGAFLYNDIKKKQKNKIKRFYYYDWKTF